MRMSRLAFDELKTRKYKIRPLSSSYVDEASIVTVTRNSTENALLLLAHPKPKARSDYEHDK